MTLHAGSHAGSHGPVVLCVTAILLQITTFWLNVVHKEVPEPYMDEIFHIGQARTYLAGRYTEWDPKITTPPGLYILSLLPSSRISTNSDDVLLQLRSLNAKLLPFLAVVIYFGKRRACPSDKGEQNYVSAILSPLSDSKSLFDLHSAFNIALFPPLFLFSALYYTDIASTVSVMTFWAFFNRFRRHKGPARVTTVAGMTLFGLVALMFRQTNVFWVAVFPAALTLVDILGQIHDPLITDANANDYIYLCISIMKTAISSVRRPWPILKALAPFMTILTAFVSFVIWNGGVVLGDKSNHIATLHLAQLLYLWPYIAFFSAPLILPNVLQLFLRAASAIPPLKFLKRHVHPSHGRMRMQLVAIALANVVCVLTVRYSTVVHPFILADNRHYVFYVFRILLRHPLVRYAIIPVYIICAWAVVAALGTSSSSLSGIDAQPRKTGPTTRSNGEYRDAQTAVRTRESQTRTSFVLIWFLTCVLQLCTAPLVEPRYSIVPWIMWRLHVRSAARPAVDGSVHAAAAELERPPDSTWARLTRALRNQDHRLWFETVWFLTINAATGYIFLYRGFDWPQEPGKVQRFIW